MRKFGLCRSCMYYQPDVRTSSCSVCASCLHPSVVIFRPFNGGFHSGLDVFHCDYFTQAHYGSGDVMYRMKDGGVVSMIVSRDHTERCVSELTLNLQNIREASLKKFEKVVALEKFSFDDEFNDYIDLVVPF